MFLHYLVKIEMFIGHVLPLSCYREKLQKLSRLNCGLQIRQIWIQLLTAYGQCCREGVQNMHDCSGAINDATDDWLPQWWHTSALGLIGPLCSQSLFQFVQISDARFEHLHFLQ